MAGEHSILVVLPVYNEEEQLAGSVEELLGRLYTDFGSGFSVLIADNGSTDSTADIARSLSAEHGSVSWMRASAKGRGLALKEAWSSSDADILAYMDIDLSTDLAALSPLIRVLEDGDADMAIGSRLHPASDVERGPKREFISRSYNAILNLAFNPTVGYRVMDAQCGFKAVTRQVADEIVPLCKDNGWFFDTELLVRTVSHGYKVLEIPVKWTDDPGTTVDIPKTAADDLIGVARLLREMRYGRI